MVMFNSKLLVYQRVDDQLNSPPVGSRISILEQKVHRSPWSNAVKISDCHFQSNPAQHRLVFRMLPITVDGKGVGWRWAGLANRFVQNSNFPQAKTDRMKKTENEDEPKTRKKRKMTLFFWLVFVRSFCFLLRRMRCLSLWHFLWYELCFFVVVVFPFVWFFLWYELCFCLLFLW